jgi:hypothetical protein
MEQATEKQVPRSLGPLYVLLLSSSFDNLQNFSPNFANLRTAVSYFENLCTHFPGVYKPVEFWQLEDQATQTTKRSHGSSVFTLKEMEEATCSFSEKNLLGKGGFGRVYRGILRSGEVLLSNRILSCSEKKKPVIWWLFFNTNMIVQIKVCNDN